MQTVAFSKTTPLIGAGVGRFLVKQIAQSSGYPYLDFADLFPEVANQTGLSTADCAPAVAVGCLAREIF
jgi:hypothetical protein